MWCSSTMPSAWTKRHGLPPGAVVRVAPARPAGRSSSRRAACAPSVVRTHAAVPMLVATDAGDEWLARLTEALAERRGVEVRAAVDPAGGGRRDRRADRGAGRARDPAPARLHRGRRAPARRRTSELGGVAVKLFDADGSFEAAGGAAFDDGSVEGIAGGAAAAAPWHEYVRPVAAAVGLVVLRSAAARQSAPAKDAGAVRPDKPLRSPVVERVEAVLPAGRRRGSRASRAEDAPPSSTMTSWRRLLARDKVGVAR